MKKSDFDYDVNNLQTLVSRTAYSYKRASQQLVDLVNVWNDLGQRHFKGEVSFDVQEESTVVSGIVCGKRFSIHSIMHYRGNEALLEARIVVTEPAPDREVVAGRFLVAQNGTIHTPDGEAILPNTDDWREYKLLAAVVLRVLGITTPE